MPDIIRPAMVASTVVTISSIADQSTLNAVSPTVSATVDGNPATITAWAWKVNGATTGITGPTTATPSYTPTTAGAKVITVDVTISGVVYSSLPEVFTVGPTALSATIDTVADRTTCDTFSVDVDAAGGVLPYTYLWRANESTAGLSSAVAESPTWSPQDIGNTMMTCLVTDAAGSTVLSAQNFAVSPFLADSPFTTGGTLV